MTVSSQTNSVRYVTTGDQSNFVVPFDVQDNMDRIKVYLQDESGIEHLQVRGTDYQAPDGLVEFIEPLAAGQVVLITRDFPLLQEVDMQPDNIVPALSIESQLDRLTFMLQQLLDITNRCVKQQSTDNQNVTLPPVPDRANKLLGFDAEGDITVYER